MKEISAEISQLSQIPGNSADLKVNDFKLRKLCKMITPHILTWKFPLNFIDFETTPVAIPFFKGMRPYKHLAVQFSHHSVYDLRNLNTCPVVFPYSRFIRALKHSLVVNKGRGFRYTSSKHHRVFYDQLGNPAERDKEKLLQFIESISHSTNKNAKSWKGEREMRLVENRG